MLILYSADILKAFLTTDWLTPSWLIISHVARNYQCGSIVNTNQVWDLIHNLIHNYLNEDVYRQYKVGVGSLVCKHVVYSSFYVIIYKSMHNKTIVCQSYAKQFGSFINASFSSHASKHLNWMYSISSLNILLSLNLDKG